MNDDNLRLEMGRIDTSNGLELPIELQRLLCDRGLFLQPDYERQIFCNRDLDFGDIKVVGFDLDYTLAMYRQENIDDLSRACTLDKLRELGYAENIGRNPMHDDFAIRGLMIDKKLGNILKMDRHGYVGRAFHGRRELSRRERKREYRNQSLGDERARFSWVDTLFELSEVLLFAELVSEHDNKNLGVGEKEYAELWHDIRTCTDAAHRDGTLKQRIRQDLDRYVQPDVDLARTLHRLRSAGKKIFLLTNSELAYTNVLMDYLIQGERDRYQGWESMFDWIVVSATKPAFFTKETPFQPLKADGRNDGQPTDRPERGRIYAGGNQIDLQRSLAVHPDEVLYIGDHIYNDIVHSKKSCGWRTALILCELHHDLKTRRQLSGTLEDVRRSYETQTQLTADISKHRYLQTVLAQISLDEAGNAASEVLSALRESRRRLSQAIRKKREVSDRLAQLSKTVNEAFNPYWGSIFSERYNMSMFGTQVRSYACIYTSRTSNFMYVSPAEYFHSQHGSLPHF